MASYALKALRHIHHSTTSRLLDFNMDTRELTAAEREKFDEMNKFDFFKVACAWCIIALVAAFTWHTCDPGPRVVVTVLSNVKWLTLVFLYADLAEVYLHIGLSVDAPLLGTITVVPKLIPSDYDGAERLRGPNAWPCRRYRLQLYYDRLKESWWYILTPEILDVLAVTINVSRDIAIVAWCIFFEYRRPDLDPTFVKRK